MSRILANIESNSIGELMELLVDEIDLPILEESRESMFKAAKHRYMDILDSDVEFSELKDMPNLVLKNRRKGELQIQKYAKDILDLLIFSSGLGDIFPKDTLSCNTSKYIELSNSRSTPPSEQSAPIMDGLNSDDKRTITSLVNIVRDQMIIIAGLRDDIDDLKSYVKLHLVKIESGICEQLYSNNNSNQNISGNNMTTNRLRHNTAVACKPLSKDVVQTDRAEHSSHNLSRMLRSAKQASVSTPVVPLNDSINRGDIELGVAPPTISHNTSTDDSITEDSQGESPSGVDPNPTPSYSSAASTEGPWQIKPSQRQRREYRRRSKSSQDPQRHNTALRGSKPQKTVNLYLQNVTMSDSDTETTITDSVKGYGTENGVNILSVYVIYNRYCDNIVGCKLSVPESQKDNIMADGFWPTDIICREWQKHRPRESLRTNSNTVTKHTDDGSLSRTVYH